MSLRHLSLVSPELQSEQLFQALSSALPIDWKSIDSVDSLKATLKQIESNFKNL